MLAANDTDRTSAVPESRARATFHHLRQRGNGFVSPPQRHHGERRVSSPAALSAAREGGRVLLWTSVYGTRFAVACRPGTAREARTSSVFRAYLLQMGPLYMKAGQVLATQSGLLSKRAIDDLRSFFSDLPPMSQRALRRTLEANFGDALESTFTRFEMEPIAAGSVAQVHRATLLTGESVAVKIVKHGVPARLRGSATLVAALLRAAHSMVPPLRRFDLSAQFAELRPMLTGQCDMIAEAHVQIEVAENFRNHPYVRVPLPYLALCTRDVLVMDFLAGTPAQDPDLCGQDRKVLAGRLQDVFYTAVFFHGFFHVDPHPGNVLFGSDGTLQLLDFGLFGRLTEDDKWNVASFYYACIRREWPSAVKRFTTTFVADPGRLPHHREEFERALTEILQRHFEDITGRWSTMEFFDDGTRLLRSYGARVTTELTLLAIGLLTGEGFVSQTDPDIDIWENARRFTDRFSPYMSDEIKDRFEREISPAIPLSQEARKEAADYLVAPTHLDRFVLPSAFPLIISDGSGSKILDIDGNEYVDLSCGYGPHILGYAHPAIVGAVSKAVSRGAINALGNPAELELARIIADTFGPSSKVILANSGTEAVMVALRLARAFTGKDRIAKFEGHYHGFSDQGMVSSWFRTRGPADAPDPISGSVGCQRSVVDDTLVLQLGEKRSLERIIEHASELAAVILEPMPAALSDFDVDYLHALRDICSQHGVLLIFDEIVTGYRVHFGGVQHLAGVFPDLTCLGKIIGAGLPCGAVVGIPRVVDAARTTTDPFLDIETKAFVGGTLSGNSVTAAAGVAMLTELRDDTTFYERLGSKSRRLSAGLMKAAAERGIPCLINGQYSIFSITFEYSSPKLVRDRLSGSNMKANLALSYYMRRHGVYVPELHTLMLGGAHSDADLDLVEQAFGRCLDEMLSDGLFAA
jgi:glutamate-1-semialdehyde 2,1-aminomutase